MQKQNMHQKAANSSRLAGKTMKGMTFQIPFQQINYLLFALGMAVIVIGYVCLSIGPWDSFFSLSLAPVLLVIGYCIIIPVAILYRKKEKEA